MIFQKIYHYLLEEDTELYEEVSAKVEPAIKLSREIIAELQSSNRELEKSIGELQNNNKALHQELENGYRNLINNLKMEGKNVEEIEEELMKIFSLTKEEAEDKVKLYWAEK